MRRGTGEKMRYFTVLTWQKIIFYMICISLLVCWSIVVLIEPWLSESSDCINDPTNDKQYLNVDYNPNPCTRKRLSILLYLTAEECDHGRRLLFAVILGALIGYERRSADRPAGIRTMALVSLGSATFTLCSIAAFTSSTMSWDASRVSAAIPSGVGFLGAGLIWKGPDANNGGQTVHGLTTAATVWLSAAVGVAAGGALYFIACFCVVIMIVLLRFGPRILKDEEAGDNSNYGSNSSFRSEEYLRIAHYLKSTEMNPVTRHDSSSCAHMAND
mmetsp:Transcript_40507/g.55143  ORF Transcript_40507/g.55143 Transcript_40507/m.55143 type:complete len:273 (-) Transcript_40507:529-1347(-)